jgi:integrase
VIYKRGDNWHLDVTVNGIRYREAIHTTDRREAKAIEKRRVSDIHAGKGASKAGREFARKTFCDAADLYIEERKPFVSERTHQLDVERMKPLKLFFGDRPSLRIKACDIAAYQRGRLDGTIALTQNGVAPRTVNMETTVLRGLLKRAKVWNVLREDTKQLPEGGRIVGRALTPERKQILFQTAATKPGWAVAHAAAVLAASTTCRGVELKGLRWQDVDLFGRIVTIRRSKTEAGRRAIPLNSDALAALARLWERAQANGATDPAHFVFPTCENGNIDPTRPQKGWRTAWRNLVRETARRAGMEAARQSLEQSRSLACAKQAWKRAAEALAGFRFHDLRHGAITELAERGESDATLMALAGHMTREMLEHYSHVRMAAKRSALEGLESGLMIAQPAPIEETLSGVVQ